MTIPKISWNLALESFYSDHSFLIIDHYFYTKHEQYFRNLKDHKNVFFLAAKESNKNLDSISHIIDSILQNKFLNIQHIIGIGGGITLDIAGFIASLLETQLLLMPTTLLSAIDATIGGKTGVNFEPYGKNQIGSFYFCDQIIINQEFLTTLPQSEILSGLCECLKHSFIAGNFIENKMLFEKIFSAGLQNNSELENFISDHLNIKLKIVLQDPYEQTGLRAILNFGHTIGHVIENFTQNDKSPIPHGIAVGHGMIFVIERFYQNKTPEITEFLNFLKKICALYPFEFSKYPIQKLNALLLQDKKNNQKDTVLLSLPNYGHLYSPNFENFCTIPIKIESLH